jgi:tetratricopeptide (TPR) repeat protein
MLGRDQGCSGRFDLMDDIHVSREILRAARDGKVPRSVVDEITAEHLLRLCPHCRAEVQAYEAEVRAGSSFLPRVSQMLSTVLERMAAPFSREAEQADCDLRELLALPSRERVARVERARNRFRQSSLVRLLLEESRRRLPGDPAEAFDLADLAWRVANRNPGMQGYFGMYVLAVAQMANACRVANDRRRADELFATARRVLVEHGVTDPEVVARVDDLLGSLRKDQRRFREAAKLLKRAAMQFGLIEAHDDAARALINLGAVYNHQKDVGLAIDTTREALALLGRESELRLHLCGLYNLAFYLTGAGRFEEAAEVLEVNEGLFRRFPEPWTQLRVLWLRGDIAAGLGDAVAAERAYVETRDGFVAQGIGYDAAMVSLDLAALYLRQGRRAEVRRLAEEMVPLFQAQDVHREALAALRLFQEAARQDRLTVEAALEVAGVLRKVRCNADPGGD